MNEYIYIIISQNTTQFHAQYAPHSLGYKEQPEDGLKWAETCSCEIHIYCILYILCLKLCCVLTDNYINIKSITLRPFLPYLGN
jgi:hypothetical protein